MFEAEYIKEEIPSALIIMVLPNSVSVTYDFLAKSAGRGSDFGVLSVTYDFLAKSAGRGSDFGVLSVTYDFLAKSAGHGSGFGVLSVTYDFWPKARRTSLDKIKAVFIVLVKKRRQMQSGTRRL